MTSCQPQLDPRLRIGDRVRCTIGDTFIDAGQEGVVVNVLPPKPNTPARARINWDNQTASMADADTFEIIREAAA